MRDDEVANLPPTETHLRHVAYSTFPNTAFTSRQAAPIRCDLGEERLGTFFVPESH